MSTINVRMQFLSNDNVFSCSIIGVRKGVEEPIQIGRQSLALKNKDDILAVIKNPNYQPLINFELQINQQIDSIIFVFEEHTTERYIVSRLSDKMGFMFYTADDPNDEPTYAGGYTFMHPYIKVKQVPYYTIPSGDIIRY